MDIFFFDPYLKTTVDSISLTWSTFIRWEICHTSHHFRFRSPDHLSPHNGAKYYNLHLLHFTKLSLFEFSKYVGSIFEKNVTTKKIILYRNRKAILESIWPLSENAIWCLSSQFCHHSLQCTPLLSCCSNCYFVWLSNAGDQFFAVWNYTVDLLFCALVFFAVFRNLVREIWFEKSGSRKVVDQRKRWFYTINPPFSGTRIVVDHKNKSELAEPLF